MVHLGHKLEILEDKGDRSVLTFTNGTTVEADLVIGADGIKSVVRQQLFSDKGPVFSGEHAYRTVISVDDAYGMATDDNLRMYIGRGTKVYLLPLRHRGQVSFDITALCPDSTWAPTITKEDILATLEGFDERIVNIARDLDMDTVSIRAVYDIDPVDVWHTDSVALVGDAAHSMLQSPGPGRELGDPGRRRSRRRSEGSRFRQGSTGVVPGKPQAGDGRAAAHLASGLDRRRSQRRVPRPEDGSSAGCDQVRKPRHALASPDR